MLRRLAILAPLLALLGVALWFVREKPESSLATVAAPSRAELQDREPAERAPIRDVGPRSERDPAGQVAGRVVDFESGEPVAGATVANGSASTTTDAEGAFELTPRGDASISPADRRRLTITAPGACVLEATVAVGVEPTLRLPRAAAVHGTVRDANGNAVAGATVAPNLWDRRDLGLEDVERDTRTPLADLPEGQRIVPTEARHPGARIGPLGNFRLEGLRPWTPKLPLRVWGPGLALETFVVDAVGPPGSDTRFDIVLAQTVAGGTTLVGDVLVNGARVEADIAWWCEGREGAAVTQPPSPFQIEGVRGTVELLVTPRGWSFLPESLLPERRVVVPIGTETLQRHDVELELDLAPIEGRVVDTAGQPVAEAYVSATAFEAPFAGVTTDQDGAFALAVPQAVGTYELKAVQEARSAVVPGVTPGSSTVEIVLNAVGRLRYRAVDARTRAPIERVGLQWRHPGEELRIESPSVADAAGWREAVVGAGVIEVALSDRTRAHRSVGDLAFTVPANGVAELELELPRGLTLELRLASEPASWLRTRPCLLIEPELEPFVHFSLGQFHLLPSAPVTFTQDSRSVRWSFRGATMHGLRAGRYRFLVTPGKPIPQPAEIELTTDGQLVEVRWEGP